MKYGNTNRSGARRIMRSPFALAAVVILFVILLRATWNIHERSAMSATKLSEAQTELDKLKTRQNDLSSKVAELSSDGGIESEIRSKFRAVKDGEQVAVLIDDSNNTAAAGDATSTAQVLTWWQKILHVFGLRR